MLNKKSKFYLIGIVILVLIFVFNIVMYSIPIQLDLTRSQAYSLSDVTIEMLHSLEDLLNVTIYISEDIPASMGGTTIKRNLQDLMDDFKTYGGNNFIYNFIEIGNGEEDDELRNEARNIGIEPVTVKIPGRLQSTTAQIIAGINIAYEAEREVMQIDLRDPNRMEYDLVKRIERLIQREPLTKLLKNADQVVQIKSYITNDYLESPGRNIINTTIEEVRKINPQKISFEEIIVDNHKKFEEAKRNDININQSLAAMFQGLQQYTGYGITFNYQYTKTSIPDVTNITEDKKGLITNTIKDNIRNILSKKPKIGLIVKDFEFMNLWTMQQRQFLQAYQNQRGFGDIMRRIEAELTQFLVPTYQNLSQLSEEFYQIESVNMDEIENVVDKYEALIVVSTNARYNNWELFHIDRFIMEGKPVTFLVNSIEPDYLNYNPLFNQSLIASGIKSNHNLYDFLENYGVKVNENLIQGSQGFSTTGGFRFPQWVAINDYRNTEITERFNLVTHFGWVSSLNLKEELDSNNVTATPFLETTSSAGFIKKENSKWPTDFRPYTQEGFKKPEIERQGKFTLGYYLKGTFDSYFQGKKVPEKPEKDDKEEQPKEQPVDEETKDKEEVENEYKIKNKSEDAKIVVIGDRDFIADWFAQNLQWDFIDNLSLMQNIIDWMIGNENLIPVRGKSVEPPQLNRKIADKNYNIIFWGNVILIPILVIILGVIYLFINEYRRVNIFKSFNNSNINEE